MTKEEPAATSSAAEVLVRERLEGAVGTVSVSAASLVDAGLATGRQGVRRRRRMQVAGGIAGAFAVLAAGGVVSMQGGLFHTSTLSPADGGDAAERVSTNPRALAAAVIADLPRGSEVLTTAGSSNARDGQITAMVTFTMGGRTVKLEVVASEPRPGIQIQVCPQPGNLVFCGDVFLGDGRHVWSTAYATSIAGQPGLELSVRSSDVSVVAFGSGVTTVSGMPMSRIALADIADDPLVGWTTSPDMVRSGAQLEDFQPLPSEPYRGSRPGPGGGSPGSVPPQGR